MGELYDSVMSYHQDEDCMDTLARSCRIKGGDRAAGAYELAVPFVIQGLIEATESDEATEGLVRSARALSWTERSDPSGLFGQVGHRVGTDATERMFRHTAEAVQAELAEDAEIDTRAAKGMLEVVGLVALAALVGTDTDGFGKAAFTSTIRAEKGGPATAEPVIALAPLIAARTSAAKSNPAADDDGGPTKSGRGMILAGVAAVVAVIAIGIAAIGGGDGDGTTDEVAADDEAMVDEGGEEATNDESLDEELPFTSDDGTDATVGTVSDLDDDGPEIVTLAVPMTDPTGTSPEANGTLTFDFNTTTGEVCYTIESENIQGPYRSHIHVGEAGVKGGIVVDLGPQESGATGCVENLPIDTNAILTNRSGHYAELHDLSEEWTIRGQLSEATNTNGDTNADSVVDTDGGGAKTVLDAGIIYLEGDVPDQDTADELLISLSRVGDSTPVVNNLNVVDGAPLPSGRIVIADAIFFDVNSDAVKTIGDETLSAIVALAESRQDWVLTVVGHTDDQGSDVYNLELSLRRATALRDLLAEQGLPDENLRIQGAGETAPIADNSTADGRAQNRRIEFEFTPQ